MRKPLDYDPGRFFMGPYLLMACAIGIGILVFGGQVLFRFVALPEIQKKHAAFVSLAGEMVQPALSGGRSALAKRCQAVAAVLAMPVAVFDKNGNVVVSVPETLTQVMQKTFPSELVGSRSDGVVHHLYRNESGQDIFLTVARLKSGAVQSDPWYLLLRRSLDSEMTSMRRVAAVAALLWLVFALSMHFLLRRILVYRFVRPLNALAGSIRQAVANQPPAPLKLPAIHEGAAELAVFSGHLQSLFDTLFAALKKTEKKWQELDAVISGMEAPLLVVDREMKVLRINPAACALFQVDAEEAVGRPLIHTSRNLRMQEIVGRLSAGENQAEEEITLGDPAHGGVVLHLHAGRIGFDNETDGSVLIFMTDITRIRRMEEIRRDFVANVSHELMTPVTAIKGFAETLLDDLSADEAPKAGATRFLHIIVAQAARLEAIIGDLLTLSRLEASADDTLVKQQVVLTQLVGAAFETCSIKAREKRVTFTADGPKEVMVWGNQRLLEQALINLVTNAVKYSDEGGDVTVSWRKGEDTVTIRVQDEGVGIEARHHERLFERFYRSDPARSRKLGGTGLGLAIVKHIVKVHGGAVGVESEPGKGSVFSITLPMQ